MALGTEYALAIEQKAFRRLDDTGFTLAELSALYFSRTLVESLTGTPFRSDDNPIPFVMYERGRDGLQRSRSDSTYGYADALKGRRYPLDMRGARHTAGNQSVANVASNRPLEHLKAN